MPVKNNAPTRFMDEVRIISPWVFALSSLGYLVPLGAMIYVLSANKSSDPFFRLPVILPLGILGGTVLAGAILLIGYIYRDAQRRHMNAVIWTLIAIFTPHALGIVLYFLLRKPRTPNCPQCNAVVDPAYGYCPQCQCRLNPVCPHCHRGVIPGSSFCPHCGQDLASSAGPAPASPAISK